VDTSSYKIIIKNKWHKAKLGGKVGVSLKPMMSSIKLAALPQKGKANLVDPVIAH